MEVLVIGGGAAGMACAIAAAERGHGVTVVERMDRVGKKLLATGNGRCNLMNTGAPRYPRGGAFAASVLEQCGAKAQRAFWEALGLRLRQEEGGRVYPASGQASTVLDTLRLAMALRGVRVLTGWRADEMDGRQGDFRVRGGGETLRAQAVVVAGGGMAQPKLGSDGSALALLRQMGHTIHPCTPALTALMCDTRPLTGLAGIRVKAEVRVLHGRTCRHQEAGEVLFTDYGLSGVCVMNSASYAAEAGCEISLNLLAGMGLASAGAARETLLRRRTAWANQLMELMLTGLCVPRLASALCRAAGVTWKGRTCAALSDAEAERLAAVMGDFRVAVRGLRGFEQAQVTRGGAATEEFDPRTMASRLVPGLYAVGEALDVDGECGGFNLMFAFGSGLAAGRQLEG